MSDTFQIHDPTTRELLVQELEQKLTQADREYYDLDSPTLSDAEYDAMVADYRELTGNVWMRSGVASPELPHGRHVRPMQSLEKVHSLDEIVAFFGPGKRVVLTPKVDGGGLSLDYDAKGQLVRALTRGDHETGEDVTEVARLIPDIPKTIHAGLCPLTVRGEVYLTEENFGIVGGKNPRNAATGILRRKSQLHQARHLSFVAYKAFSSTVPHHEDDSFRFERDMLLTLAGYGFPYPPAQALLVQDITEDRLRQMVEGLPYWTDGVVITLDDWAEQRSLGLGSRAPKYAVAYKFAQELVPTRLVAISWAATRTGRIVPTGIFEPVEIDGTTVTRATLHNWKNIETLGITLGCTVGVLKANQVIPRIEKVLGTDVPVPQLVGYPTSCPSCRGPVRWSDVDLHCDNEQCGPKLVQLLVHFGKRGQMDIDGLGEELAAALVEEGVVKSLADLYSPALFDLLPGLPFGSGTFGQVRTDKLGHELWQAAKKQPWRVVLHSLGCPGLGEPECKAIALNWGLGELLEHAVCYPEDFRRALEALKGIGPTTASIFTSWLYENREWLVKLVNVLNTDREIPEAPTSTKLAGTTWVITGTLSKPRSFFEALLVSHGATVTGSVSKKTSYLLAGNDAGSKLTKAESLGIPVLHEDALSTMLA